jgi:hypothetical protein
MLWRSPVRRGPLASPESKNGYGKACTNFSDYPIPRVSTGGESAAFLLSNPAEEFRGDEEHRFFGGFMYTLFLKYTLDPNKLESWKEYAAAEFEPITESGGKITGYYAPTEFSGATSEAFATIDVGTMAEYEVYRAKLAAHPKHKENVVKVTKEGSILSIYRAIIQRVDPRETKR